MSKLNVYEFGWELLSVGDLDPVYILLHEANLPRPTLLKWLLAYWCYYNVGTASWITEGNYWQRMEIAAGSKDYPRSSERRHFRGANAAKSVAYLKSRGVEELFYPLLFPEKPRPLVAIMAEVKTWVGFGDWIAFKVADMLERLGLVQVIFPEGAAFLFDSPRDAADLVAELEGGGRTRRVLPRIETSVGYRVGYCSRQRTGDRGTRGRHSFTDD